MKTKEINSVFIAKCIGISLVVIAHFYSPNFPAYWIEMRNIIYTFHMPLFFMLAGYLYGLSPSSPSGYFDFLRKKVRRLLVPFISFALFYFIIKSAAGTFIRLDYPVNAESLCAMFICPEASYFPPLWFIYTLFIIFMVFPALCFITKGNRAVLTLLVIGAYFIDWPKYFALPLVFKNLPVFAIGYMVGVHKMNLDQLNRHGLILSLIVAAFLFVASYLLSLTKYDRQFLNSITELSLSVFGSIACICVSSLLSLSKLSFIRYMKAIGYYSMTIYLLHGPLGSGIRIAFFNVLKVSESQFLLVALAAVILGILLPLLVERYFLRNHLITRKFFLGLS